MVTTFLRHFIKTTVKPFTSGTFPFGNNASNLFCFFMMYLIGVNKFWIGSNL